MFLLRPRSVAALLASTLAVSLGGCKQSVDLAAVRDLAKAAAAAEASFDAIATDYRDSCVRRNVYGTIGTAMEANFPRSAPSPKPKAQPRAPVVAGAEPLSVAEVATLPAGELSRRLAPAVAERLTESQFLILATRLDSAEIFQGMSPDAVTALDRSPSARPGAEQALACSSELKATRAWQQANAVVINYFVALGKLAGGAPGDDSFGVKALGKEFADTKALSSARSTALGNFANDVLTGVYDAKRRGALAQYIPEAEKSLNAAIQVLQSLASDDYVHALNRERVVANRFFRRNLQLTQHGQQAFEVLAFADTWSTRMKTLDDRAGAATAYVGAWETLRTRHTKLLTAIANNDAQSALAVAQSIYDVINPDITAIDKAFSGGK